MGGLRLQDEYLRLVPNAVSKRNPNPLEKCGPNFDRQEVIILCRVSVTKPAFNDGENDPLLLPFKECAAQFPEEFPAGGFEQIEVTRIVYMVAEGAFAIGDPMRVAEDRHR